MSKTSMATNYHKVINLSLIFTSLGSLSSSLVHTVFSLSGSSSSSSQGLLLSVFVALHSTLCSSPAQLINGMGVLSL